MARIMQGVRTRNDVMHKLHERMAISLQSHIPWKKTRTIYISSTWQSGMCDCTISVHERSFQENVWTLMSERIEE